MGVHEHEVRSKTDRLIAAVEALTVEMRTVRQLLQSPKPAEFPIQPNTMYLKNYPVAELAVTMGNCD